VTISMTTSKSNSEMIYESNPHYSHCSRLLQEGRLRLWLYETVCKHLGSPYVAQVNLSISSTICSKILLGPNLGNCSAAVDSVRDTRDQRL
jgi:hypothetical protein